MQKPTLVVYTAVTVYNIPVNVHCCFVFDRVEFARFVEPKNKASDKRLCQYMYPTLPLLHFQAPLHPLSASVSAVGRRKDSTFLRDSAKKRGKSEGKGGK